MYLVKLFSYFEDNHFVYIILELCRKRYVGNFVFPRILLD